MNDSIIKRHEKMTIKTKKCHHNIQYCDDTFSMKKGFIGSKRIWRIRFSLNS